MIFINKILKNKKLRLIIIILSFFVFWKMFFLLSLIVFPLPEKLTKDFSLTYYYQDKSIAWITLNKKSQYRTYIKLKDVSPYLKKGIVFYEDKFFYLHPGFNPVAIVRAFFLNASAKRVVAGGSTITMQLARLSEPKKRTIFNKIIELLRSFQLETRFSKKRILELYLNMIPMGGNIEGVSAASFFYFNKRCKELSFVESALLICISNSPVRNRPDRFPENTLIQRKKVAIKISKKFGVKKKELNYILNTPIPASRYFFNYDIIPLIFRLNKLPYKRERVLSLDRELQDFSLSILKSKLKDLNCINGALIIIDNRTMQVLTYIGSPFYQDNLGSVKFNAANVLRSPGSTLKPFIYARAMETGIITQKKKLFDFPEEFYGYKPKNFSNKYDGIIDADEALIRSLNIPAVYLTDKLGKYGIKYVFKNAGFRDKTKEIEDEDLSIALGSYPMTLENLVELYAALANKGKFNKLCFLKNAVININKGNQILSEESTFIISEILSEVARPDLPTSWEFTKDKSKIAFKTGTSYGFVDAWSIGYTPRYTIGVWVGNLDNRFTKILTGISSAAPILFGIMNELERHNDQWFIKPNDVKKREVCAVSGMVPGNFCNETVEEYYIPKFSDNSICDVHKKIYIEKSTNQVVSLEQIDPDKEYDEKIIELWDEKVEYFLKKLGKKTNSLSLGDYSDIYSSKSIEIFSPSPKVKYIINYYNDLEYQKIPLMAYEYPDSGFFYWYANKKYIGKIKSDSTLYYLPDDKKIRFSVVDDTGRSGSVEILFDFVGQK
jgi:penicillin-binding protein 1C